MAKKNFLLMSLEDTKIKKVSNVISNDSCRKILDFLSEKDATESEIAKKLSIPISTVNYNLKQLVDTGLIESTEFHYSEKGKEVAHYRLANKYIIIAPKSTYGIKERLKGILPIALISAGAAGIIQIVNKYLSSQPAAEPMIAMRTSAIESAIEESAPMIAQKAADSAAAGMSYDAATISAVNDTAHEITNEALQGSMASGATSVQAVPNIALWFLAGAIFALLVYFVAGIIRKRVD